METVYNLIDILFLCMFFYSRSAMSRQMTLSRTAHKFCIGYKVDCLQECSLFQELTVSKGGYTTRCYT